MLGRVLLYVFGGFNVVAGIGVIIAHALARNREPRRKEACGQKARGDQPPSAQTAQTFPQQHGIIRRHGQAQQEPYVEELVVVVLVGLEEDELRNRVDHKRAAGNQPLLAQVGGHGLAFGFALAQRQQDEHVGQADVFEVEPQVVVHQPAPAAVVAPVELEAQEVVAAGGLHKGEGDQLRQAERSSDHAVDQPRLKGLPFAPGREHAVQAASGRKQRQRQIAVGVDERKPSGKQSQQHKLPQAVAAA